MADTSLATPPPPPPRTRTTTSSTSTTTTTNNNNNTLQRPPAGNHSINPRPFLPPPPRISNTSGSHHLQNPPAFRRPGNYKPTHRRRRCNRSICCRLCIFLTFLFISLLFLIAIAAAISYLYFQPHLPYFRLQTIQNRFFNVTTKSDGSGTFLDADLVVKVLASNKNNGKIWVSYSESSAGVYVEDEDGDVEIGWGDMDGFEQGKRNATVMRYEVRAKGVMVVDEVVGRRLKGRFQSKEMKVGIGIRVNLGVGTGKWRTCSRIPVRVDCTSVSLKEVKTTSTAPVLQQHLPKCDIYLFRWINLH